MSRLKCFRLRIFSPAGHTSSCVSFGIFERGWDLLFSIRTYRAGRLSDRIGENQLRLIPNYSEYKYPDVNDGGILRMATLNALRTGQDKPRCERRAAASILRDSGPQSSWRG